MAVFEGPSRDKASGLLERLDGTMFGRVIENAREVIVELGR